MGNKSTSKTPANIVKLLKSAVAAKGQSAVARETGLTLLTVQNYLKGIGEPRQINLERLSKYFGMSIWQLRGESPPEKTQAMMDEHVRLHLDLFIKSMSKKMVEMFIEEYKRVTGQENEKNYRLELQYSDGSVQKIYMNGIDVTPDPYVDKLE